MKMKLKRSGRLIGAATLASLLLCTALMWSQGASLKAWRLLGRHSIGSLHNAERVEVYRVKYSPGATNAIGDYAIVGKSKVGGPAFTRKAAGTVLNVYNTKPYVKLGSNGCEFNPGVAFRFVRASEVLDALVCYDCSDIAVISNGGWASSGGFHAERAAMRQLAKEAFPDDAEIQKL